MPQWPPNLMIPMMLLRENLQQSVYQNLSPTRGNQSPIFHPGSSPNSKGLKIPIDINGNHACPDCGRIYKLRSSLRNHQKWECGKEPQFKCPFCSYKAKQKMHMMRHTERMHKGIDLTAIKRAMNMFEETHVNSSIEEVKNTSLNKGQEENSPK
ncbi:longitudinals lacking protein, isoforms A/B/D/L-like [Euwallacea similis]|uniref:longitudinals lacking protein, isoforms A/B/D/L-like n=1 Tax=Euwallacea similis TaxID=1736056 RepID=UPI00344D1DD7